MAAAKYHVIAGFVTFAFFAVAYFIHFNFFKWNGNMLLLLTDTKWLILGLFLALLGATLSDFDLLYKYLNPWHHRSFITHSAIIPTIVILAYLYPTPINNYAILLVSFMLGFASHLFLDLFPSIDIEKLLKQEKYKEAIEIVTKSLIIGLTTEELLEKTDLKKLSGTYNIQFPQKILIGKKIRKMLSPNQTRIWLIMHGTVILVFAIILFTLFAPLL